MFPGSSLVLTKLPPSHSLWTRVRPGVCVLQCEEGVEIVVEAVPQFCAC